MVTVAGPCYDAPISRSRHSCLVQTCLNDSPGATLGAICNKSRLSPELRLQRWKVEGLLPSSPASLSTSFPSLFSSRPRAGGVSLQVKLLYSCWLRLVASDLSDILSRPASQSVRGQQLQLTTATTNSHLEPGRRFCEPADC